MSIRTSGPVPVSTTLVAAHHGRNRGYSSTRSTRSNICSALYGTSTDFWTLAIATIFAGKQSSRSSTVSIVDNKKAYHDYFVEEKFEAGLALEGWEVKAIRAGRAQLKEAYVVVRNGEIVLLGAHVTPLATASTHIRPDATRTRKLLLHRSEINRLIGKVQRAGYTLTPLDLHFSKGRIKLEIGLARGKKQYDKRAAIKEREWNREKQRLLRNRLGTAPRSRSR